jgi:hypothetical protein
VSEQDAFHSLIALGANMPTSLEEYIAGIRKALATPSYDPEGNQREQQAIATLSKLETCSLAMLHPDESENLLNWIDTAFAEPPNRLTAIVGETRGRPQRDRDMPHRMTAAATSDGVAAFECAFGIHDIVTAARADTSELRTKCIVDEWLTPNEDTLRNTNLIVIGSGEVNLAALFLNGLVPGFHYGQELWDLGTMGDVLICGGQRLRRSPGGNTKLCHAGGIILLKNPWNLKLRLLWVSGLTGLATFTGGRLVSNGFKEWRSQWGENLSKAIGAVFKNAPNAVVPICWLAHDHGNVKWRDVTDDQSAGSTPEGESMKDFFISYNSADKTWAEWIAWTLEEAGYSVVIQAWDFQPGGNFVWEMQKAATGTQRTIAVLSDNYLNAEYTQPEWGDAFAHDPKGNERTLIPVRIAKCRPKGLLATRIYADLVGLSGDEARTTLLEALRPRAKPHAPPAFPGSRGAPAAPPTSRHKPAEEVFPGKPSSAIAVWREKLEFLQTQEAITVDAAQKFALKKQIEEAKQKLDEFGG